MESDGRNQTRLTHNEASDSFPAWSPNRKQIAFGSRRDGNREVYVMDTDGNNQRNLTLHPAYDGAPTWAPDGSQIAFISSRDGGVTHDANIYVMDADGSNIRPITRGMSFVGEVEWAPDGRYIAFEGHINNPFKVNEPRTVYAIDPDGTSRWQVSEPVDGKVMFLEGWSPDGKKILYAETINNSVKGALLIIATLHPIRNVRQVVKYERVPLPKMDMAYATWGADGESILVTLRKEGGAWNIYRFRLGARQLLQLTDHPVTDSGAREWNPRLPASGQGLAPKRWGEIRSNS